MKAALLNFVKAFLANIKTIILSLVLSVILWLAISFQVFPDITRTFDIPLSVELTDYMRNVNLKVAGEVNEIISISVEGKRYDTAGLTPEDFYAHLDLSDVRAVGEYEVNIVVSARDEANMPFISPNNNETRMVKIIQTAEKTIELIPDAEGINILNGMTIESDSLTVSPKTITISGEKSLIDSVHNIKASVISKEPISSTEVLPGELVFLDENGDKIINNGIFYDDSAFAVTVPVYKRKTLPLKATIINAPDNFNLESLYSQMEFEPKELTIASPDSSIDNHEVWDLGTISLSDITYSNLQSGLPVEVSLPSGYLNVSGNNLATLVFGDVASDYGVVTFYVPSSNFNVINKPAGYDVKYITNEIAVKVVGPSNVIHSMVSSDLSGTINLAGITDISTGERTIGAKFTVSGSDVLAWVIGEYKIDIDITESSVG